MTKEPLLRIDDVVKKFGFERVTIGTDHGYSSQYSAQENKIVAALQNRQGRRAGWEMLWPPEGDFQLKPGMQQSMAWTNWPLFTVGMVQMGYSDNDIQKILGGNALRVARAVLA